MPATQPRLKPVIPPLIQLTVADGEAKIVWPREMLAGFRAPWVVLTKMLKELKRGILETFTR